jgi:predicted metal-dependent hydrolase
MESIKYGTKQVSFNLERSSRKTLGIEVHPDLSVWAKAPIDASIGGIKMRMLKRSSWIIKQQKYFEQFLPRTPRREYVSGETHLYLGRRYQLKVKKGKQDQVKLKGAELTVFTKQQPNPEHVRKLLTSWYFNHAEKKFEEKFENIFSKFRNHNLTKPNFEIRRMKNRWGSCTPKGKIILNPELIKTPGPCIDYVITHELCHIIHPSHDKKFYSLQEKMNPDWKRWKDKLELILV